jgi:polyphosphate kinase
VTDGRIDPDSSTVTGQAAPEGRYLNRELSWLDFNARVLSLAEDPDRPLLERVKFVAIASGNLDEFFQIRVAGLKEQVRLGVVRTSMDGRNAQEQLQAIRFAVEEQGRRQERLVSEDLVPALNRQGIRFCGVADLNERDRHHVDAIFREQIFPVLTPLAVDPAHPFPYISNLSLNLAVHVGDPESGVRRFARVKVPPLLPRFVALPDGDRFIPLEQLIALNLRKLFPGMDIGDHFPFRVTRNADLELEEDEAADLLVAIEEEIRRRRQFANVVRLEVDRAMSTEVQDLLARELGLLAEDVYESSTFLDLGGMWELYALDRSELKDPPWTPATQVRLASADHQRPDLFSIIRENDVLVHHPYDSFATSVESFIAQAAMDPAVLAIKQTLYRTSGQESPIVRSLIRAAEAGKQVVALVELRARFDEQANIAWARALEEAGVHVVYGLVGLKTHAKISLVVRHEAGGIRRYAHIGTGNYNPTTATIYEDVGLLTAKPELGADLTDLFNFLTGYSRKRTYRRLLVAPLTLRDGVVNLIRREAERADGQIVVKVNNLIDGEVIDALYEASGLGTPIDLVVRSICGLRPGVPGLSENIRVRSIVGRYLEHARILRFGPQGPDRTYLIGSADLMPRNLDWRVEALTPVTDPPLQARLDEILEANLADDQLAWDLTPAGTWRPRNGETTNVQTFLQDLALRRMRGEEESAHA